MYAPKEIIHALESVLGLLYSDIKNKERATFILCDNMVEVCCRTMIKEKDFKDNKQRSFFESLNKVNISDPIKTEFLRSHDLRNSMQHDKLSLHVSFTQCSDFIVDIIELIKELF